MKNAIILIVTLFTFLPVFELTGQCDESKGRGHRLARHLDKGHYTAWVPAWRKKKARMASHGDLRQNFQCQAQAALDKLLQQTEYAFASKNRSGLNRIQTNFQVVLRGINTIYPQFHASSSQKDYLLYSEYLDYLAVITKHSARQSAFGGPQFERQLHQALNELLVLREQALAGLKLDQAKNCASDFTFLLDALDKFSKLPEVRFAEESLEPFLDQYQEVECTPFEVRARRAFQQQDFVQALGFTTQCSSEAQIQLARELQQKLSDFYYGRLTRSSSLLSSASVVAAIDSLAIGLATVGIDNLPCPRALAATPSTCQFYEVVNDYRQDLIVELLTSAEIHYNAQKYAKAMSLLDAAIQISNPGPDLDNLMAKRMKWLEHATLALDTKRKVCIENEDFKCARKAIDDIASFNASYAAYEAQEQHKSVLVMEQYTGAQDYFEHGQWLPALKKIQEAIGNLSKIHCAKCRSISLRELEELRDRIILRIEEVIDDLNENDLNLDAASDLVDEVAQYYAAYPAALAKARLECIFYTKKGDKFVALAEYNSAFGAYVTALNACQRTRTCTDCAASEQIKLQIRTTIERLIEIVLDKAKTPFDRQDYISACELVEEAQQWVAILQSPKYQVPNGASSRYVQEYQSLSDMACSKARRTVKVVVRQTSAKKFSETNLVQLKHSVERSLQSSLRNKSTSPYGKYIDVVSTGSADYTLVVNLTDIRRSTTLDQSPTVHDYCTYTIKNGIDAWGRPIRYYAPLGTVSVRKYTDKAYASVDFTATINNYSAGSDQVSKSWSQDAWRADIDPKYLAFCGTCPVRWLSNQEKGYFSNKRNSFPSTHKLTYSLLERELQNRTGSWARQLSNFVRR